MVQRSYKYRLYPSKGQSVVLTAMLGAFCDLYNATLQQRIEAYRRQHKTLRYLDQANELKAVRAADERLAQFSYSTAQQVLRRLDKAFTAFFRRLKTKAKAGFPRFQAKHRFDSAEFRVGDGLTIHKSKRLGITGIPGEIKVKWHRDFPAGATVGAAVLSRAAGTWFVCFKVALGDQEVRQRDSAAVSIDVGLSNLIATSDGETVITVFSARLNGSRSRKNQKLLDGMKQVVDKTERI